MKRIFFLVIVCGGGLTLSAQTQAAPAGEAPAGGNLTLRVLVKGCASERIDVGALVCMTYLHGFYSGVRQTTMLTQAIEPAVQELARNGKAPITDDMMNLAVRNAAKKALREQGICISADEIDYHYVQAVAVQYAREHAEMLDDPAESALFDVFAKAFPCKQARGDR
jgi:hypothetical protein